MWSRLGSSQVIENMERETGFEPTPSSLGRFDACDVARLRCLSCLFLVYRVFPVSITSEIRSVNGAILEPCPIQTAVPKSSTKSDGGHHRATVILRCRWGGRRLPGVRSNLPKCIKADSYSALNHNVSAFRQRVTVLREFCRTTHDPMAVRAAPPVSICILPAFSS